MNYIIKTIFFIIRLKSNIFHTIRFLFRIKIHNNLTRNIHNGNSSENDILSSGYKQELLEAHRKQVAYPLNLVKCCRILREGV